jgi:hypothetical protein
MSDQDPILNVFLKEYDKLKTEQAQRIGFRDNLLYATLGVYGVIVTFAFGTTPNYTALLVLPWVSIILGWTYLVNDEKITAIGRYIRLTLVEKVKDKTGYIDLNALFGWEIAHRDDDRRKRRKIEQLIIYELTFVVSGIVALITFWLVVPQPALAANILAIVELILLIVLGVEIVIYADLAKGR